MGLGDEPEPRTNLNELQGVVQISPDNAWAAGYVLNGTAYRTLILHWNGTAWKRVQSPNTGVDVDIDSMHAWAVGSYAVGSSLKGFILRRDGTKWKRVQLPSFALGTVIDGVKAISPRNVWAVGDESTKNLVLHWNGRSWKKVQVQNSGTVENIFHAIDALSADEFGWWGSLATRRTSSTRPARCTAAG